MAENFESQHTVSSDLKPLGGQAITHGAQIQWANGEERPEFGTQPQGPVGARVRDILEMCEDRASFLASTQDEDWNLVAAQLVDIIEQIDQMAHGNDF